jgi:type I restriction enzyme R subunit
MMHILHCFTYYLGKQQCSGKVNFESNEFSVSAPTKIFSLTNPGEEIDMVVFINGLPIATMEPKKTTDRTKR